MGTGISGAIECRRVFRYPTRADAVAPNGPWQPGWSVMETLAALHGPANVRMVVWFDR